jgi:hypothetical protein
MCQAQQPISQDSDPFIAHLVIPTQNRGTPLSNRCMPL